MRIIGLLQVHTFSPEISNSGYSAGDVLYLLFYI